MGPAFATELRKVLVIDDSREVIDALRRMFAANNVEVLGASRSTSAVDIARSAAPQLAIMEIGPGGAGLELISELGAANVVVGTTSSEMNPDLEAACLNAGARWCLSKPFDRATLYEAIIVNGAPLPTILRVDLRLEAMTFEYIDRVISSQRGSKSAAARILGKPRQSLQRKLKRRR